jgi:septum formation protein
VPLILASASPRRAELLAAAGFEFEVVPADVDETLQRGESPQSYALRVARAKAQHVVTSHRPYGAVLAADTVVVVGDRVMGKPADSLEAASMLRSLSGTVHDVLTAVVVQTHERRVEQVVTTRVRFHALTEGEIAWYVETGEPNGKAGAYAIQGRAARFIEWIEGSWSNVVGLPISAVYRLLTEVGHLEAN